MPCKCEVCGIPVDCGEKYCESHLVICYTTYVEKEADVLMVERLRTEEIDD